MRVQLLSCVWLFSIPWTAARQASLFFTISWSLLKLMSIESLMPSNHLILCRPLLLLPSIFPSIRVPMSQFFASGGQSMGISASISVHPMNIQDWFPLTLTGLISSPRDSQKSYPTPQLKSINSSTLSPLYRKDFQKRRCGRSEGRRSKHGVSWKSKIEPPRR